MLRTKRLVPAGAILLAAVIGAGGPSRARAACTDPDAGSLDPQCAALAVTAHVTRTVCDPLWLPQVCDAAAFADPGYTEAPPASSFGDGEFLPAFGIVHEHSGYSDGDPNSIPRDYFAAAKTGSNGVRVDFLMSSEHSENEKLPVTTAMRCIDPLLGNAPASAIADILLCNHVDDTDHYFKWQAELEQAAEATDVDENGDFTGFTAIRGFEWTNDIQNHMNVFFSRNVVNAKVDGSYLSMDFFWNWLREPVSMGGGADALVTFNHPGGDPHLTPLDPVPDSALLKLLFTGNWNDLAYVPDVDANLVGMELNGGDDIEWYVKALSKGWHLGAVAAEDHHGTNWSSPGMNKTVVLTKGRSPRHYYEAMKARRTYAVHTDAYSAAPNATPTVPRIRYFADAPTDATSMGARIVDAGAGSHVLHVEIDDGPVGSAVSLVSRTSGLDTPIALGTIAGPAFAAAAPVSAPAAGTGWWFVVIHTGEVSTGFQVVTAPIWIGPRP